MVYVSFFFFKKHSLHDHYGMHGEYIRDGRLREHEMRTLHMKQPSCGAGAEPKQNEC